MEPIPPKVPDIVKQEATREAVKLLFSLLGSIGAVLLVKYLVDNPDGIRTAKMWLALGTKRTAQTQVDFWQNVADKAATIYNGTRDLCADYHYTISQHTVRLGMEHTFCPSRSTITVDRCSLSYLWRVADCHVVAHVALFL
jgi:hypothetical protein